MEQNKLFPDLTNKEIDDIFNALWRDDDEVQREKKCECGCDKIYGKGNAAHSTWCPKYNRNG